MYSFCAVAIWSRVDFWVLALPVVVGGACGRWDLDSLEPCHPGDTTRPCRNACGEGTQACVNGSWTAGCTVAVASRPCMSVCGGGTEMCVDGQWRACDAP